MPLADSEAGVRVTVTHNYRHVQIRMIAVESDGSVRGGTNHYQVVSDKIGHTTMTFPGLSLKQAVQRRVEFQFQVRPYHWVEFHNVSLRPGRRTQVEVLDEMRN